MDLAIMIEGQMGLNWPRWQNMARAVEDLGFAGLYRSDHFVNTKPPDQDSLDLWISLAWLASHTRRIEFGPLVTPMSFRNPVHTARMAAAVDDLSGGRLVLGLGAGWMEIEHERYGFDLLDMTGRFARFEEALQVVTGLLKHAEPLSFQGSIYQLKDAVLLPRPQRPGGPPILIGGTGEKRTLPLVARYADEWNSGGRPPDEFRRLSRRLDELLVEAGRAPKDVRRSMMTGCIFGRDLSELGRKVESWPGQPETVEEMRRRGMVVGTGEEIAAQLAELENAGVQRVMLQWLDLDDLPRLEALARFIIR